MTKKTAILGCESTAEEVIAGHDLSGRCALVTGGSSGIGKETVRVLSKAGCRVWLTSRQEELGYTVIKSIEESNKGSSETSTVTPGKINFLKLDLADLNSARDAADEAAHELNQSGGLDYLVLNAGIMACPKFYTQQGLELQLGRLLGFTCKV